MTEEQASLQPNVERMAGDSLETVQKSLLL